MSGEFLRIVFTSPTELPGETAMIERLLLEDAADIVHLRKPGLPESASASILGRIRPELHSRIRIHDNFRFLDRFRLGGVHLNSRNPVAPEGVSWSRSCHTLEEVDNARGCDYVTLSPIFDSISKEGYTASSFDSDNLRRVLRTRKVIALGGVTPDTFSRLSEAGFSGAALLGYVWNNPEGKSFSEIVDTLRSSVAWPK